MVSQLLKSFNNDEYRVKFEEGTADIFFNNY